MVSSWGDVKRLNDQITEKLTFKQYHRWTTTKEGKAYWCEDPTYEGRFVRLKTVTKSKELLAMADAGLKLISKLRLTK